MLQLAAHECDRQMMLLRAAKERWMAKQREWTLKLRIAELEHGQTMGYARWLPQLTNPN